MAEEERDTAVQERGSSKGRKRGTRRPANKPSERGAPAPDQDTAPGTDAAHDQAAGDTHDHVAAPDYGTARPSEAPGLLKVLWADIRGRRLPRQPSAEELQWEAEEEAEEAAARASFSPGTDLTDEHMERWRRRTMTSSD